VQVTPLQHATREYPGGAIAKNLGGPSEGHRLALGARRTHHRRAGVPSPFELNKPDYLLWGCFRSSFASSTTPGGCLLQLKHGLGPGSWMRRRAARGAKSQSGNCNKQSAVGFITRLLFGARTNKPTLCLVKIQKCRSAEKLTRKCRKCRRLPGAFFFWLFFLAFFLTKFVFIEGLLGRARQSCCPEVPDHVTREGKCEASHRGKGSAKGTEDAK
jgi:hypothetical protein